VGDWTVAPELNSLERNGRIVRVEPKIMQVLVAMAEHPGDVVSKEQLFLSVWRGTFVTDEVLTRSISELRKVFEDNPREPTYIQTIPKGGYRLLAPVEAGTEAGVETPSLSLWQNKSWTIISIAAILLIATISSVHLLRDRQKAASGPRITSLAVLPLSDLSGDTAQDYFVDGLTDELITRLSKIQALRIISRTSVMHYKGTKKTIPEIARELDVDAVVEGTVFRSGDRVRISAQLIRALGDQHMWAESYERDLRDVLALQADVAGRIAAEINTQVTPQERSSVAAYVKLEDPQAYDAYLKGQYYWNKFTEDGMRKAVVSFEQAIQLNPHYAPAYAGLAHAYHELAYYVEPKEVMPKGKAAALRALELDENDAGAHAALGWIKWHYDWDWSGAEKEYRRALEINPGNSLARAQYADYLDAMGSVLEGLQEHKIVLELDPLSLIARTNFGGAYAAAGRYDEAAEQYRKTLELDANFVPAHADLGEFYAKQGKFPEALAHLKLATQLDSDLGFEEDLAMVYAVSGNRKEARQILHRLVVLSHKRYVPSLGIALIFSALGEQDESCRWLEKAYDAHDSYLAGIKNDPYFIGPKSTPCFQEVRRRIGY
jgi:TolB-like protein/DNA-binding winged helix-turn-helix (wHTH) protein/Tfp pilus assembly protein PilF